MVCLTLYALSGALKIEEIKARKINNKRGIDSLFKTLSFFVINLDKKNKKNNIRKYNWSTLTLIAPILKLIPLNKEK